MALHLEGPLVLAGAGKMGGALLAGLLDRGLDPRQVIVQDPAPPADISALLKQHGISTTPAIERLSQPPALLLAAVKPQVMDDVFAPLAKLAGPHTLTVSIAAGRSLHSFEAHLPLGAAVVRAMPNTPASVGRGITACVANRSTTTAQTDLATELLSAVGAVIWLDNEAQMDAVTAVSGSGPAYVFLLAECLADAGRAAGLSDELAARLARATVSGAGELLHRSPLEAGTLRQNVTSPGGTTAAALSVLMSEPGLKELIVKAVAAAAERSRELSK
jgi:pyrroline-5-carboxylate reductase